MPTPKMMTLHWSPRSPYVRKVMIAAHELGLEDRLDRVRTVVGGTTPHLGLMEQNPLGKLPTLVLDDGTVIYDSYVIIEYLDTLAGGGRLFPANGHARITELRWHALGNGMLDILLQWLGERGRPEERQSPAHIELWRGKIHAAVDSLDQEAEALAAAPFGIGQIAIGVALGYLDFRFAAEQWRDGNDSLADWYATFLRRPSVVAHAPVDDS